MGFGECWCWFYVLEGFIFVFLFGFFWDYELIYYKLSSMFFVWGNGLMLLVGGGVS